MFYRIPVSKGTERAVMNTYTYSTVYLFSIIFISLLLPYTMAPLISWMNYKDNAINARLCRWRKIRLKLRKHTKRKKRIEPQFKSKYKLDKMKMETTVVFGKSKATKSIIVLKN